MGCLTDCFDLSPPPDSILFMPPPPAPVFMSHNVDNHNATNCLVTESCDAAAFFLNHKGILKNFDGIEYREMPSKGWSGTVFRVFLKKLFHRSWGKMERFWYWRHMVVGVGRIFHWCATIGGSFSYVFAEMSRVSTSKILNYHFIVITLFMQNESLLKFRSLFFAHSWFTFNEKCGPQGL